jgi:DNA polymerase I-like protein with 3'-5' exonuclease and polymerase domains
MITLDFETFGITQNPIWRPPLPVGCAVWIPGQQPMYMAWGHPTKNNIKKEDALTYLDRIHASGKQLLFHNAPFDLAVGNSVLKKKWALSEWGKIHDTQFLLFLDDPYADTLSLKPSAARYLGIPPDEQTELKNWILSHVPAATESNWGAYIAYAPGDLVGKYAVGDVTRTKALFDLLHPKISAAGMEGAYDRERRLMPIVFQSAQRGVRVDRTNLETDALTYKRELERADEEIRVLLRAPSLDFGKRGELAEALDRAGFVTEWALTKTGRKSTSKKTLKINDARCRDLIAYRGVVNTCLSTFYSGWLQLSKDDGRLHPEWNQVRTVEKDSTGAKTGRMSCKQPNLTNVPTEFEKLTVPSGFLPPPMMRKYLLPEVGHVWLKRDFSSQEVRILSHFEDGSLLQAYQQNPDLDPHQMAKEIITENTGLILLRKQVKIVAFACLYGSGVPGVGRQLEIEDYQESKAVRDAYLNAMPDVQRLMKEIQALGRAGGYITTWGGRRYYVEPAKIIDGKWRSFEYKLLNYLVQGSAADQTKQTIIDWDDVRDKDTVFMAAVHDEGNVSAPEDEWQRHMKVLQECFDKDRFDCPFKSEGFYGPNWQEVTSEDRT